MPDPSQLVSGAVAPTWRTIWYMSIIVQAIAAASPKRVWEELSDIETWPDWLPTVEEVRREEGTEAAYVLRQPRLPEARWVITNWHPGRSFTWRSSAPGVTTTGSHELRPVEGGTAIELTIGWSGPMAWLARLLYSRLTRGYLEAEATALARRSDRAER